MVSSTINTLATLVLTGAMLTSQVLRAEPVDINIARCTKLVRKYHRGRSSFGRGDRSLPFGKWTVYVRPGPAGGTWDRPKDCSRKPRHYLGGWKNIPKTDKIVASILKKGARPAPFFFVVKESGPKSFCLYERCNYWKWLCRPGFGRLSGRRRQSSAMHGCR